MAATVTQKNFPPGPQGAPIVGSMFDFRRGGTLDFYRDVWQQ